MCLCKLILFASAVLESTPLSVSILLHATQLSTQPLATLGIDDENEVFSPVIKY